MRHLSTIAAALATALLLSACQRVQTIESPSGRSFTIYTVSRVPLTSGVVHMVQYRTEIPLDEIERLKPEVLDLWAYFQPRVVETGAESFVISPTTPRQTPFLYATRSINFVFQLSESGEWELLEPSPPF